MGNELTSILIIAASAVLGVCAWWLYLYRFSNKNSQSSIGGGTLSKDNDGDNNDKDDALSRSLPTFEDTEISFSRSMDDPQTTTEQNTRTLSFPTDEDDDVEEVLLDEPQEEVDLEDPVVVDEAPVAQEPVLIPEPVVTEEASEEEPTTTTMTTQKEETPVVVNDSKHIEEETSPALVAAAAAVPTMTNEEQEEEAVVDEKKEPDESTTPPIVAAAAPTTEADDDAKTGVTEEPTKEDDEEPDSGLGERLKTALVSPKEDEMNTLFEEIDQNGDGSLSMHEVERAIFKRHTSFSLKPAVVLRAYQSADANQDGKIGKDEFFSFLRMITYFKNLNRVFTLMDTNGDRRLSKEEFLSAAPILDVDDPEKVWEEMDQSGHGYVVFDEFCFWMSEKAATSHSSASSEKE